MIKLSLLDFGRRETQFSSLGKILDVIDYCEKADELGYKRFWLSEHHNFSNSDPWSNPLVLLPILLGNTERINVGVAGILLNYYSSYEVAMHFKLLNNVFPDRVDLGVANGTPPLSIINLLRDRDPDTRNEQTVQRKVNELSQFFLDEQRVAEQRNVVIPPFKGTTPSVFLLSSSFKYFQTCLDTGFYPSISIFHNKVSEIPSKEIVEKFKEDFFQRFNVLPEINIAFTGICARNRAKVLKIRNEYPFEMINPIMGSPSFFYDKLMSMSEEYGINEFTFHCAALKNKDKIRSIELLSEEFNLIRK